VRRRAFSNVHIHLEGLRKTTKGLSEDCRSRGRDLNPELPEYETGLRRNVIVDLLGVCHRVSAAAWRVAER
jgi:hypothetical protein